MKSRLPIGVCILISLALVLVGLGYGTFSGFAQDRAQVMELLEGESGLKGVLSYRGADGLNLCVVAERHLSGDADVAQLRAVAREMAEGSLSLSEAQDKDEVFEAGVKAVAAKLRANEGFLKSERDQRYLTMLESDLASLSQNALHDTYNAAAEEFNQKLESDPMGKLAGFLGVAPCELYR